MNEHLSSLAAFLRVAVAFVTLVACRAEGQEPQDSSTLLSFIPELEDIGNAAFVFRPSAFLKGEGLKSELSDGEIKVVADWTRPILNYPASSIDVVIVCSRSPKLVLPIYAPTESPITMLAFRGTAEVDSLLMQLPLHEYQFDEEPVDHNYLGTTYRVGEIFNGGLPGSRLSTQPLNLRSAFRPDPRSLILTLDASLTRASLQSSQNGQNSGLSAVLRQVPDNAQFAFAVINNGDITELLAYGSLTENPFLTVRFNCRNEDAADQLAEKTRTQLMELQELLQNSTNYVFEYISRDSVLDWLQAPRIMVEKSNLTVELRPTHANFVQIEPPLRKLIQDTAIYMLLAAAPTRERLKVQLEIDNVTLGPKNRQLRVRGNSNLPEGLEVTVHASPILLEEQLLQLQQEAVFHRGISDMITSPSVHSQVKILADGTFAASLNAEHVFKAGEYSIKVDGYHGYWTTGPLNREVTRNFDLRGEELKSIQKKEKRLYRQALDSILQGAISLSRISMSPPDRRYELYSSWNTELRQYLQNCDSFESLEAVARFRTVLFRLKEMEIHLRGEQPDKFEEARETFEADAEAVKEFISSP